MKKKKFNKKLSLNKETISNLDKITGGGGVRGDDTETRFCTTTTHATCWGDTCCGTPTLTCADSCLACTTVTPKPTIACTN